MANSKPHQTGLATLILIVANDVQGEDKFEVVRTDQYKFITYRQGSYYETLSTPQYCIASEHSHLINCECPNSTVWFAFSVSRTH